MSEEATLGESRNPFPGLRPFREDEDHLFFGRESQVDTMVNKLATTKFLAVVGTSGSGKSSLVNCGLRPALYSGLMTSASTDWRIAKLRPGNDPLGALAKALSEDGVLFQDFQNRGLKLEDIIDTTLRMSKLGLIDMFEQSQLDKDVNLLVVVDQFEELFRYRRLGGRNTNSSNHADAITFVNLLLEVAKQRNYPIYVVITMRSDFLGDCSQFQGLAEAINSGQYLVPRLTREERRAAISGPIKVAGADILPVLLTRLVNDVGDNPDQLSILQHALNRTWAYWQHEGGASGPIELRHYQAIGTMAQALNNHAEKAYHELRTTRQRQLCRKVYKAITDIASDSRGVRRPTTLGTLCSIVNATEEEITEVINVFRKPSRSFMMPPIEVELNSKSVVDISHESLMRVWNRLRSWASEEAMSVQMYRRLVNTSLLHSSGEANLWRNPDLQLALDWKKKERPTLDWARQYNNGFETAMGFLQKSKEARDREAAERRFERRLRIFRRIALFLLFAILSWNLWEPLQKKSSKEYRFGDNVKADLRKQQFVALDPDIIKELEALKLPDSTSIAQLQEKISTTGDNRVIIEALKLDSAGHDVKHMHKALEQSIFWLPDVVILEKPASSLDSEQPFNEVQELWLLEQRDLKHRYNKEFDIIFALNLQGLKIKNVELATLLEAKKEILGEQGIVFLSPNFKLPRVEAKPLRLVPHAIDVMLPAKEQSKKISLALKNDWVANKLLKNPGLVRPVDAILTILLHLLVYFLFVFGFEIAFRKLIFSPLGPSPLEIWWGTISNHIYKLVNLFKTRPWNLVLSIALLLIGVSLVILGWLGDFNWKLLMLGLAVILAVPVKSLFSPYWAVRFKTTQGMLLRIVGFYLWSLCFVDILDSDPVLSSSRTWQLILIGLALVIMGNMKNSLSAAEKLLLKPNRPPVLYFRLPQRKERKWKRVLGLLMGYGFSTDDEKILYSIFGTLGPFIGLSSLKEVILSKNFNFVDNPAENPYGPTLAMSSSNLVILQVEEPITDHLISRVEQALRVLKPEQLLLYFSQQIDEKNLGSTYYRFVSETEGIFTPELPVSIGSNRVIAFDDNWQPILCGKITKPKIWWAGLLPLFAQRVDISKRRRSFVRSLRPFFDSRSLIPVKSRLYSDFSISVASFYGFALGFPAGIMIFRNFWQVGRKWAAMLGLISPLLVYTIITSLGFLVLDMKLPKLSSENQDLAGWALLMLILVGSPFATHWLWRRVSGRKMRYQAAFSGSAQPWWMNLLVILIASPMMCILLIGTIVIFPGSPISQPTTSEATSKVVKGNNLALTGDVEGALVAFQEAQNLEPDIDLDSYKVGIQNNPRSVAMGLAASSKVQKGQDLVWAGDIEGALAAFQEAQNLEPDIDLDPYKEGTQNDPKSVTAHLTASSKVQEAYDKASNGSVHEAIAALREAQKLKPGIDLDPYTELVQNEPEKVVNSWASIAKVTEGINEAKKGEFEKARQAFSEAFKFDPMLNEDASSLNNVGWWLSLGGYPEEAIIASENAVKFAANNPNLLGHCLDTRGLARALTGDIPGSIKDFEAAIASPVHASKEDFKAERQEWIDALRKGGQPFTAELLEKLQTQ